MDCCARPPRGRTLSLERQRVSPHRRPLAEELVTAAYVTTTDRHNLNATKWHHFRFLIVMPRTKMMTAIRRRNAGTGSAPIIGGCSSRPPFRYFVRSFGAFFSADDLTAKRHRKV